MPALTVTVTGQGPILAKLAKRQAPMLDATLRKAENAAARAVEPFIEAESPVRTGKMRGSVKTRGAAVGPTIWYRHFVIRGTKRGVRANPFVDRGARKGAPAARAAFTTSVKAEVRR